jgi:hypothetical protein
MPLKPFFVVNRRGSITEQQQGSSPTHVSFTLVAEVGRDISEQNVPDPQWRCIHRREPKTLRRDHVLLLRKVIVSGRSATVG